MAEELEKIYKKTQQREQSYILSVLKSERVGNIRYRGRILRADDLLNITSGNATGICQRISENSTRHAAMEDTGRTFVVEEIDEGGNSKMVARSWVWRNNGVICFDNIELASELQNGNIEMEKQKAILEVYKSAAEIILKKDKKKFDRLLKRGKITQEQYDAYRLTLVTVGTGLGDLRNSN